MSRAMHYTDDSLRAKGKYGKTACGRSLVFTPRDSGYGGRIGFSYNYGNNPEVTENAYQVTCKGCLKFRIK